MNQKKKINNIITIYNHFYFYFVIVAWLEKLKCEKEHTSICEIVSVRLVVVNEETEHGLDVVERKLQWVGI